MKEQLKFRDKLVESVRESGKWITANAEKLVPDIELLSEFSIEIAHDNFKGVPTIRTNFEHICLGAASAFKNAQTRQGHEEE